MLNLITGNSEKVAIANAAVANLDIKFKVVAIKCTEIQSDCSDTIAKESAKYASSVLKDTVVKLDSGLYLEAFKGFPGVYSEYTERKLSAEDILRLMSETSNRRAYYKESLAYVEYGKEPVVFTTRTEGSIAYEVDGSEGYPFDKLFICKGDSETMSNYSVGERAKKYSHDNWKALASYLNDRED